ncbi:MAG: hypothetical protein WBW81_00095 [Methylocella sp.]
MVLWLILLQHAPCGKFTCGERAGEIILSLSGNYRCLSHYREKYRNGNLSTRAALRAGLIDARGNETAFGKASLGIDTVQHRRLNQRVNIPTCSNCN